MPRVKRGVMHVKRRRKLLSQVKGYKWGRKTLIKRAQEARIKAGVHAYVDRRKKKRTRRASWQIAIGAWAKQNDTSYSKLTGALKAKGIALDRKILAELAIDHPAVLTAIVAAK
jgi:large subunit ribosomal protein L20